MSSNKSGSGNGGEGGNNDHLIKITLDSKNYHIRVPENYQVMNFINTLIVDDLWPYNYHRKVVKFMLKDRKQDIDDRTLERLYDSIVHVLPEIELDAARDEMSHRLNSLIEMTTIERQIEEEKRIGYNNLEFLLKSRIFGQDKALDEIITSMNSYQVELIPRTNPLKLFLLGPSGVGKTETVNIIEEFLGKKMLRVDCQDYQQEHEVLRLRGAPPSYIGHDEKGGILTRYISKNSKGIILFDEVEKAHPNLFDALIGVMDTGDYADTKGNKYHFNGVIFFTSNIGNKYTKDFKKIGFGEKDVQQLREKHIEEEFKKTFKTYFAGRLDKRLFYQPLDKIIMSDIMLSYKRDIDEHLKKKNLSIKLSNTAFDALLDIGLDVDLGVRHMKNAFNSRILDFVASQYIKNDSKLSYNIDYKDGKFILI